MRSGYGSVLDGIPFNLSLSPEARHSQASEAGTMAGIGNAGSHVSVPFTFGTGPPLQGGRSSTATTAAGGQGGVRDSSVTYRTSIASSSAHTSNDKRDTAYSLASEWNGAFAGMPILMGGIAEEAVPEVPSMYRQSTSSQTGNRGNEEQKKGDDGATNVREFNDDRYSSDSLAMAAAVARQFDERND